MAERPSTRLAGRRVGLRPMRESDLALVDQWLGEPLVTRRWLNSPTPDTHLSSTRERMCQAADTDSYIMVITEYGRPIGWAQSYRWGSYPLAAEAIGAQPDEIGLDCTLGVPEAVGRRLGTELIAALVRSIRRAHANASILVVPDATNLASVAVLRRSGFRSVDPRSLAVEATDPPVATYRLAAPSVRLATRADGRVVGLMLDQFNREYDEPTPGPEFLAARISELIETDETAVLLIDSMGRNPEGLAVLRFRSALWSNGSDCNLAELYIAPAHRGLGLGRAIMRAALRLAGDRGAVTMDIGVHEPDLPARQLYESLGFTNRGDGPEGPLMFFYQRDLKQLIEADL
jgi:RimJ/RimL family protein N-acetyltransferase